MKPLRVDRGGEFRENRWTRLKLVCRSPRGFDYEVERFEPLARGAETFLRDQASYFARLGYSIVGLEVSQAEGFDERYLNEFNPSRHWRAAGFSLTAEFSAGIADPEGLIALVRGSTSDEGVPAEPIGLTFCWRALALRLAAANSWTPGATNPGFFSRISSCSAQCPNENSRQRRAARDITLWK